MSAGTPKPFLVAGSRLPMIRLLAAFFLLTSTPAIAQVQRGAAEAFAGYAGFVDDVFIDHFTVGGNTRIYLSPRIGIGPEVVYMRGPGADDILYFTGNVTFDLLARQEGRIDPFLVIGGGFFRGTTHVGTQRFTNVEGAVTGGGGARINLTDRLYAVGEFRLGWEPHYRVTGGIGATW